MLSKKITAIAAGALLMASSAAVAQTAPRSSALSVAGAMQGADDGIGAGGPSIGVTLGVLFGVIAIAALTFGSDDDGDETPASQ
jgi:hypothetical protein